jgi:hypothetical protein
MRTYILYKLCQHTALLLTHFYYANIALKLRRIFFYSLNEIFFYSQQPNKNAHKYNLRLCLRHK